MSSSDMLATISLQLGILAEEMLARVRAALGLEVLVLAVDALFHHAAQQALRVARQQRIPARAPDHLDDVPAGAEERGLELLDDLAVAAHRAVEALQVAVDDEHQVVELLAHRQRERAHRLRLVHLAVAEEAQTLRSDGRRQAAVLQVALKARLVDRHHRARGPSTRSGTARSPASATDADTTTSPSPPTSWRKCLQLVLGEPAFEEGARVDAGRCVALDEHHVAGMLVGWRAPEMIEADFVQRGRRGVGRDVAAVLAATPCWRCTTIASAFQRM